MANEKEKATEKDQQTITPTGSKEEELSEKDLDKASGAGHLEKWIAIE